MLFQEYVSLGRKICPEKKTADTETEGSIKDCAAEYQTWRNNKWIEKERGNEANNLLGKRHQNRVSLKNEIKYSLCLVSTHDFYVPHMFYFLLCTTLTEKYYNVSQPEISW